MTHRNDLKSLRTFAKRYARMKRVALHESLDLIAGKLGQTHWHALAKAWDKGWRPTDVAVEALFSMDEASDPVMAIPVLGIGQGVKEYGELDGHQYLLEIDFEVLMAQISWWSILLEHAPSAKPIIEIYNTSDANPIFDPVFKEGALAICHKAADRLRARIAADWPRRSTKPDADGQAEHPISKGVSNRWHCLHCDGAFAALQMAENMWHCPKCSASPIDIFVEPFWKAAS